MTRWIARVEADTNAVEITHWEGLAVDLQYADSTNESGQNLYCGQQRVFLHRLAAQKLKKALTLLKAEHPGYKLIIWDAARPLFAQQALWDQVKGTSRTKYVSNPRKGSLHNYGMALDVTAQAVSGSEVAMGSGFDDFSPLASASSPALDSLRANGHLSERQVKNRKILKDLLRRAGWVQLPTEWWHFNAAGADWVRANLRKLGE